MESSSEITDLKKLLSDLKVALESRHMNHQDTQHRIRNMTEMLENGYVKDEETLHQQRREATQAIGEAQRAAEEDRKAAAMELKQAAEQRQDIENGKRQAELERDRLAVWKAELTRQKQELTEQREKLKRETEALDKERKRAAERKDRELIGMQIELRGDIEKLSGVVKAGSEQAIDALAELVSRIDAARAQAGSPKRRRKIPRSTGTPDSPPSSSLRLTLSPTPRRLLEDRSPSRLRGGLSRQTTLVQGGRLPLLPPIQPGPSSPLGDPVSADSPSTTAPASLEPIRLAAASEEIKNIWRQIQFPSNWTSEDSAALLESFTKAKARSGGGKHRYWPQQAMDNRSAKRTSEGLGKPFCLDRDLHRTKPTFEDPDEERYPCVACTKSRSVCVDVSFVGSDPGPYVWNGTEKRWSLVKQQ